MSNVRKICVITGSRADYGLLRHLMRRLAKNVDVELQTMVTGSHLVGAFGNSVAEIEGDGFKITEKVDMLLASDTPGATALSLGLGVLGATTALQRLNPDLIVLLGDRYEALAAAQSAMLLNIPIAHIHGGEATEGLIDEAIRHSITKMAHLHFVASTRYAKRVIQLGEHPSRVFVVGAAGLDNIDSIRFWTQGELETSLDIYFKRNIFLVTYHPLTLQKESAGKVDELLRSLSDFPNTTIVFTGSNADASGRAISEKITKFCEARPDTAKYVSNLGVERYLSLMKLSNIVIGNSSSGLIEAPSIGTPTVNIGDRQRGRLQAKSVVNANENYSSISEAIKYALNHHQLEAAESFPNPYGGPGAAAAIEETIAMFDLSNILMKKFYEA
ncbi:UDP-N-acetylglucosamine 2-epimerase [Amylibacter sp.]|nr:UDP-N-acetylglucosamine 2-epimerase [Amylibacter sp.]